MLDSLHVELESDTLRASSELSSPLSVVGEWLDSTDRWRAAVDVSWCTIGPLQELEAGKRFSFCCSAVGGSSRLANRKVLSPPPSFLLVQGSPHNRSSRGVRPSMVSGREKLLIGEFWKTGM